MSPDFVLDAYDFVLPQRLIAQTPSLKRDHSRLLFLPPTGTLRHLRFDALPELLRKGDLIITNQTAVIPARLRLRRVTGGRAEALLCHPEEGEVATATRWRALGRPATALKAGATLFATDKTAVRVLARREREVVLETNEPFYDLLVRAGEVPLPPYIQRSKEADPERQAEDKVRYQSIFARVPGAVAAPTASLHFTETTLSALAAKGVERADVTLHVGPGTFLPVAEDHADDVRRHPMHQEWYEVPEATQQAITRTRAQGGRVVAVGTTALRAVESFAQSGLCRGESRLYILPGYVFSLVDGLITNFHLPRSTLLFLVSAMVGRKRLLEAYREAIDRKYRFFSYGDAMVIL